MSIVPAPEQASWEKQPDESNRHYSYFAVFRDLGPTRTLAKAATALNMSPLSMEQLSPRHNWMQRAQDYDLFIDRRRREASETEIVRMAQRHVAAGQLAQRLAIQRLQGDPQNDVAPINPNTLDATEATRLLELGVKTERMARGMPTEVVRGAFSISPHELQSWMRDMVELALQYVPDDRRDVYITAVYALVEGRLGA